MTKAISVENVGKEYRLGSIGARSFSVDFLRWRNGKNRSALKEDAGSIWALRNINFEVEQGEAVGIIGRNGAGKSTLLKILSRITTPTEGEIKVKGRLASLLEVGTGFHAELTGRENIFLNGAILGMERAEVLRKFDEIVDFAGVEKFIDTPVKRYSSGMYVRLAFAVAAHLEPEILIVDEVLAVGDAEFQKKCLGKMNDVAHEGRTVLFVSHNMVAIKGICTRSIWINGGKIKLDGDSESVILDYLSSTMSSNNISRREWDNFVDAPGSGGVRLKSVSVRPVDESDNIITTSTALKCNFQFWNTSPNEVLNFSVVLKTSSDVDVFNTTSVPVLMPAGLVNGIFILPSDFLNEGIYKIRVLIVKDKHQKLLDLDDAINFEVHDNSEHHDWYGKWTGVIHPKFDWAVTVTQENSTIKLL